MDLEGEDFSTIVELIRTVLLIMLQEYHNWRTKKKKKHNKITAKAF